MVASFVSEIAKRMACVSKTQSFIDETQLMQIWAELPWDGSQNGSPPFAPESPNSDGHPLILIEMRRQTASKWEKNGARREQRIEKKIDQKIDQEARKNVSEKRGKTWAKTCASKWRTMKKIEWETRRERKQEANKEFGKKRKNDQANTEWSIQQEASKQAQRAIGAYPHLVFEKALRTDLRPAGRTDSLKVVLVRT